MVVNPEDVQLNTDPGGWIGSRTLPPGGPYDHVIITRSADVSYWQVLADWRTKSGLKSIVVNTTYIYDNYPGSDHQAEIRNFIIDARNTWGTMYFLLCGENGDLPFEYRTYEGDNIPSDQYYGDYDDDWDYEVYVGRSTARGYTEVDRFIDKVLKYEQDPPLTNYILDVTLLGMDLTRAQDPPYYTLTRGEYLKQYIDNQYVPSRFTVTEVYDTDASNHRTDFINALNDGQGLVNHNDHANWNVMCTGDRNHGWYISNSTVDGLTNNNRMSVIYSLGCHCNEMDASDCIAEHFVIYNSLQAGVAYTGNTRSGWFYVGDPYSLSCDLDRDWWRGLFYYDSDNDKYILGEALAYTKNLNSHSGIWAYCQWTLNLLGEPAMPIWTDTPQSLTVTHPSTLPIGVSSFTVHVEAGGGNLQGAYVCLWKGDEVYLTDNTGSDGNAFFNPSPTSVGDMYVTVTKHNYLPYEGYAEVVEPQYTLNITVVGNGTVTKDPDQSTYTYGTIVELTADADEGWSFLEWSGDASGSSITTEITMDGNKNVTATFFELFGYWLDLNDFPMYEAESQSNQKSGAAVAQMTVNYMWWDSSEDPEPPELYSQLELYTYGDGFSGESPYFDMQAVWHCVQDEPYRPTPYTDYGYNFVKRHNTDPDEMLKQICYWIDYPAGRKEFHPVHVPALVPAYGNYTNWMAIRGIHTDIEAWPIPDELEIFGFWVNDPFPSSFGGIGENSYKSIDAWINTYYLPVAAHAGEYLGVFEPPESV
ncbi:hypothetical protein KA005_00890, partial [bacterium]|nr:hypothetical protein [bacterium]